MWQLKDLLRHCSENSAEINGKWVPARPLNYKYRSFFSKIREAWAVFTGRAAAFRWPEGQ
jgi:hypothetical protein